MTQVVAIPISTGLPEDLKAIFNGDSNGIGAQPVLAMLMGIYRELQRINPPPAAAPAAIKAA